MDEDEPPLIGQPTSDQKRRALAYLLIGLGAPLAAAFLYVVLPAVGRRGGGPPLWTLMEHTSQSQAVVGGLGVIGALFLAIGGLILSRGRNRAR